MDKYEKIKKALEIQNTSWEKEELWNSIEETIERDEKKDRRLLWLLLPGVCALLLMALFVGQGKVLPQAKSDKLSSKSGEERLIFEKRTNDRGKGPEFITHLSDSVDMANKIRDTESHGDRTDRSKKIETTSDLSSNLNDLSKSTTAIPHQLIPEARLLKRAAQVPFIDVQKALLKSTDLPKYPSQFESPFSYVLNENPGKNYFFNGLRGRVQYSQGQIIGGNSETEGDIRSNISPKESVSIGLDFYVFNNAKFYGTIGCVYRRTRYNLYMSERLQSREEFLSPRAYEIVTNSAGTVYRPGLLTQTRTTIFNLEASNIVSSLQMPLELGWRNQIFREDEYGFFLGASMSVYRSHNGSLLENTAIKNINQSSMPMTLSNIFGGLFFNKHLKQGMSIGVRLQYLRDLDERIDIEKHSVRLEEFGAGIQFRKEFLY